MTGNFLDRWSRLKRSAEDAKKNAPAAESVEAPPPLTPDEIRELIDSLPDIASLTHESDFSVFMQGWVPDDLRRDALRRLWTVDKSVLEHVPLADYALDYNTPGAAPGYGSITASADMIADVARMMGKAAFPESTPGESEKEKSLDSADGLSSDVAAAPVDTEPLENKDIAVAEMLEGETPRASEPETFVALREDIDVSPPFPVTRRRHGAAAPR